MAEKHTICIDFDGVIHEYRYGWDGGQIRGEITRGFFEWAEEAAKHFQLVIYSTRSKEPGQVKAMVEWLQARFAEEAVRRGLLGSYFYPKPKMLFGHTSHSSGLTCVLSTKDTASPYEYTNSEHVAQTTFYFSAEKPVVFLTIDDRAMQFTGGWIDPRMSPEALVSFKPWNAEMIEVFKK